MSEIKVQYRLTQEAIRRIGIETGVLHTGEITMTIDLVALTPEQRARLLAERNAIIGVIEIKAPALRGYAEQTVENDVTHDVDHLLADADDLIKTLDTLRVRRAELEATALANRGKLNAKGIASVREFLADEKRTNLGNVTVYDDADGASELRDLLAQAEQKASERIEARKQAEAEEKARKEAEKEERNVQRLAWAKAHGSERLIRCLEAGYDCASIYYAERAKIEYPGFELDTQNNAAWKERSAPTLEALDAMDAAKKINPEATVEIVWLTAGVEELDERGEDEFEPCEALAVDDPNYSRWLVKII